MRDMNPENTYSEGQRTRLEDMQRENLNGDDFATNGKKKKNIRLSNLICQTYCFLFRTDAIFYYVLLSVLSFTCLNFTFFGSLD